MLFESAGFCKNTSNCFKICNLKISLSLILFHVFKVKEMQYVALPLALSLYVHIIEDAARFCGILWKYIKLLQHLKLKKSGVSPILYFLFKVDEMQYFALPLALHVKHRRCCLILQDSVKVYQTASKSKIKKNAGIFRYMFIVFLSGWNVIFRTPHSLYTYNRRCWL